MGLLTHLLTFGTEQSWNMESSITIAKRRCGSMSKKVKLHVCKQGLRVHVFNHMYQHLELCLDTLRSSHPISFQTTWHPEREKKSTEKVRGRACQRETTRDIDGGGISARVCGGSGNLYLLLCFDQYLFIWFCL